jgi:hypothetical protein
VGCVWLALACYQNAGQNDRRLGFFGFSFATCEGTAIFSRVVAVLKDGCASPAGAMLFASTHVTLAAMTLYLMHSDGGPEYSPVDEGSDEQDTEFGIDEETADDDLSESGALRLVSK